MKQSEKDKIIELIERCNNGDVVLGSEYHAFINKTRLFQYIDDIPVEPDPITEVYAIKNCLTGEVIWNAHGCPYKYKDDVEKKVNRLKFMHENKDKAYQILTFKLDKQ